MLGSDHGLPILRSLVQAAARMAGESARVAGQPEPAGERRTPVAVGPG